MTRTPKIARRAAAAAETDALLAEIPTWDDALLIHMRQRFTTSRLFRQRHDPEGPLTPAARQMLIAADEEIARRGLALPEAPPTGDAPGND